MPYIGPRSQRSVTRGEAMSERPSVSELPAALQKHRGSPVLVLQLGLLGGRTVLLTDAPALYVHDAGGLLQDERTLRLDPLDLSRDELVFASRSTVVRGTLKVKPLGELSFESATYVDAVAHGLPVGPGRACPLPISVAVRFTGGAEAVAQALQSASGVGRTVLAEHDAAEELYAHPEAEGGRLLLRRRGEVLVDLPLAGLQRRLQGREIGIEAEIRVLGLPARGLDLCFPTAVLAARFFERLGAPAAATSTPSARAVDAVDVTGQWGSAALSERAEAAVGAGHLTLRASGREHTFGFADPGLRVAGDDEAMVWADERVGPLRLTGPLVARLAEEPGVRDVAQRTTTGASIPCTLDDVPVLVDLHADGVAVRGPGEQRTVATGDVQRLTVEGGALVVTVAGVPLRFRGALEALAAVHAGLGAGRLAERYRSDPGALHRVLVALEGRYLLYTVFGPIAELHGQLRARAGAEGLGLDAAVPAPDDDDGGPLLGPRALELAAELLHGAARVERHLERAAHRLPAYLTARDAAVLAPGQRPPLALKQQEGPTRGALVGVRLLAQKLGAVHEPLRHALATAGVEVEADYSVAALSTLAGVLNPVFLLAGASQALAASNQAERVSSDRAGGARRAATRALERWNQVVLDLLAPVAQQVADGLFPVRWAIGKQLAAPGDDDRLRRLIARVSRLDTFLRFPPSPGVAHPRGEVVAALVDRIDRLADGDGFALL